MEFDKNVPLNNHSTMRLGGKAKFLAEISDKEQIPEALKFAQKKNIPVIMIGSGSNIVWSDKGFEGLVLINKIKEFKVAEHDVDTVYVRVGAGESWDKVVKRTAEEGLHGIEALSLIPGTAGATPIQNVGAYGQDVSQTLVSVEAYDSKLKSQVILSAEDCDFGYRTSRFKAHDRGRFYITNLIFSLSRSNPKPPYYEPVAQYFKKHSVKVVTPSSLRKAVVAIRRAKLPDPAQVANNGSFFANPIVTKDHFSQIIEKFPDIAHWPLDDETFKLSAAWLIEKTGYKNFYDRTTGMSTWATQPLVLVNQNAKSTSDLILFRDRIIKDVEHKFTVKLQQEPELI